MNFLETFSVALRRSCRNKVRSGLTMLGVIIGVMAVILLVSIGEGAQVYITKELTASGRTSSSSRRVRPPPGAGSIPICGDRS